MRDYDPEAMFPKKKKTAGFWVRLKRWLKKNFRCGIETN